ncbi:MAG: tetratricopeptide repeat protein [bacterium]
MSFVAIKSKVVAAVCLVGAVTCVSGVGAEDTTAHDLTQSYGLSSRESTIADALAHYVRGLIADGGDAGSREALAQLEESFRLNPGQADTVMRLAARYQDAGRTNDLLRVLEAGCARYPDDVGLHYYLGGAYQLCALYDKALSVHSRIIEHHPADVSGYLGSLQVCLARNDERRALEAAADGLRKATNADNLGAICRQIGIDALSVGDFDRAVKWLTVVRLGSPEDLSIFLMLFEANLRNGDRDSALSLLLGAPAKYRDNPRFHYMVARILLGSGCFKESLDRFDMVERIQGALDGVDGLRDAAYYHQYGVACERSGRIELAEKQFAKSLEMDGNSAETLNYLAYMWAERTANLDRALEYVNRALAAEPANPAYLDTLGWIYFKQGKMEQALELVDKAHSLMPEEAVIAEHMGDILQATKETDKAVIMWKKSFMADPENKGVGSKLKVHGVDIRRLQDEARATKKTRNAAVPSGLSDE